MIDRLTGYSVKMHSTNKQSLRTAVLETLCQPVALQVIKVGQVACNDIVNGNHN